MSNPNESRLLKVIETHHLASDLRKDDPSIELKRFVLAIPPEDQADNLTTGTMGMSPDGNAIAPAVLVSTKNVTVIVAYYISRNMTGHVGWAHGGAIATILDECCGRASLEYIRRLKENDELNGTVESSLKLAAYTAQLSISYLAPVTIGSIVIVQAVADSENSKGRKITSRAKLWTIGPENDDEVLAASAEGLFLAPKGNKP